MTRARKRVLLTGGRIPSALELARALAAHGAEVYMLDSYPIYLGQASRAVKKCFQVPAPRENLGAYRQAVLKIIREEAIHSILPCSEEVLYLATFREDLEELAEVYFAKHDLLHTLHHKQSFIECCQNWGLAVPSSQAFNKAEAPLPAFTAEPYILKKVYSRAGTGVKWARAATNPRVYEIPDDGSWLLQEGLKGRTLCSFSLIHDGEIIVSSLYSPGSALGTVGVSFERIENPAISDWIAAFAAASSYHGFVSFDFIEKDGQAWAIECNPRLTSGIHLLEHRQLAYAVLWGKKTLPLSEPRKRAQFFLALLAALPRALGQPSFWPQLPRLLRSPDVVASLRDPAPFFFQWLCILYFLHQAISRGKSLAACAMDGIEWEEDRYVDRGKYPRSYAKENVKRSGYYAKNELHLENQE